jgi:hypothetical protein
MAVHDNPFLRWEPRLTFGVGCLPGSFDLLALTPRGISQVRPEGLCKEA